MKTPKTIEFIKKARLVHGNRYVYKDVDYATALVKITIICRKHGPFQMSPNMHLGGQNCQTCSQIARNESRQDTTESFVRKAIKKHKDLYTYDRVRYKNSQTDVLIGCRVHGLFKQRPVNHLNGQGCSKCCYEGRGTRRQKGLDHFILRASEVHGSTYDYSEVKYDKCDKDVVIRCKTHGTFKQKPMNHYKGQGCPLCAERLRYSKIAIEWIEYETKRRRLKNVMHAENGGEFCIPGTKYKADGFHKASNTVFEFYGDCYHGNLERYRPMSKPNPFSNKTAKQLYHETVRRENELRSLGYIVVSIWERDYNSMKK